MSFKKRFSTISLLTFKLRHKNMVDTNQCLFKYRLKHKCTPMKTLSCRYYNRLKGWEPTFLIKGIGLSKKAMTGFGFVFYDIGLKSQNLQLGPNCRAKQNCMLFFKLCSDFKFVLEILSILFTMPTQYLWFSVWKMH